MEFYQAGEADSSGLQAMMDEGKLPHVTQGQVAQDFDGFADTYEDKINSAIAFAGQEHSFYIDIKREHILRLAQCHFGGLDRLDVLDLGCGLGGYHPGLEGKFRELHGVDVSTHSVKLAASRHPFVHYSTFDGYKLPYRDGQFSVVFTICVMHHVPPAQWKGFVAEMHRVTAPGGLALVFEHNPYNPATQYVVNTCDIDKDAVLLTPGKLRRMFSEAVFVDARTRTIITVPPAGRILTGLDSLLGHLPFGAQYYLEATKARS